MTDPNTMYAYRIWNTREKRFESSGQSGVYTKRRTVWMNKGSATTALKTIPDRAYCVIKQYELVEVQDANPA
jgi:hypothetical protein